MKKKIVSLLFISLIALISMSFSTTSTDDNSVKGSALTIYKGELVKSHHGGTWESVAFGVSGLSSRQYIAFAEITTVNGEPICIVNDFERFENESSSHDRISWYNIELGEYEIHGVFRLLIHIKGGKSVSPIFSAFAIGQGASGIPTDPDETVLTIRYP